MYYDDRLYKTLASLIKDAGVRIIYQAVPDDCIDGEIWARADSEGRMIMMPDEDVFPDAWKATEILGHEMAHILTGVDSPDDPEERQKNESICDEVGRALREFAALTLEKRMERDFFSTEVSV